MSTLTLGKPDRITLGTKRKKSSNSFRSSKRISLSNTRKKSPRRLASVNQFIVRTVMLMLTLSLVAVLGVGLLYGYRFLTTNHYFELKEIHVTGIDRLSREDILKNADVTLGLNCLDMNVGEVEQRLSANPWIQSVTVRREFPNRLRIGVEEKIPAFWIRQGDGLYFADASGQVIAPMHPGETASLPLLSIADGLDEGPAVLKGILKKMEEHKTPFTQKQTAWVKLTSAHEVEIFLDGHADGRGLTVKLCTDQWETQLERMKVVWRDLLRRNEFKDAAIIAASGEKVWIKKRIPTQG